MVFQHFGLLAHRTVIDNVAFGLEIRACRRSNASGAPAVLELVGLQEVAYSFPSQLSGGSHSSVEVARLRGGPGADALRRALQRARPADPSPRQRGQVGRLQKETGKTMLFITDLPGALRLGDRIAIMRDGAIVQLGSPEGLRRLAGRRVRRELHPRHPARTC